LGADSRIFSYAGKETLTNRNILPHNTHFHNRKISIWGKRLRRAVV